MKRVWSPWRMKYVTKQLETPGCLFCNVLRQNDGLENLIVYRGNCAYVILNRYPYTSGHLMIVPNAHVSSLTELDAPTRAELFDLLAHAEAALRQVYSPEGFNIGANLGEAAGAGIPGLLHFHVVPRWCGDTNFMSVVGETRVLPENLAESYQRIQEAWQALAA